MASFPGSIYSPTNPVSTNPRTSPSVAAEVAGLNGEVVAIETALGTNLGNVAVFPSGIIMEYAGTVAPTGWLLCQGQAVSRATYSGLNALANAAGYVSPWGAGNGTTTFNVPNLIGIFTMGAGTGHTLGTTGGSATSSAVINHTHAASSTDSGHTHASPDGTAFYTNGSFQQSFNNTGAGSINDAGGAHTASGTASITTTTSNPSGGVASMSLYPPYIALQKIIKT